MKSCEIQLPSTHCLTLLLNKMHACNVCKYIMSSQKRNLFCIKLNRADSAKSQHKKYAESINEYSESE